VAADSALVLGQDTYPRPDHCHNGGMFTTNDSSEALSFGMGNRQWAEVDVSDRESRSPAVMLLMVQDAEAGGWFVAGYDRSGHETSGTWHGLMVGARLWAASQFGHAAIGSWQDIPDDEPDPIHYALRRRH
jgi:hypothetical protein